MGKFINPFTDFGFKHIFGREMDKDILIEFLNDLLEGEHTIKDLRIMNNERFDALRESGFDTRSRIAGNDYSITNGYLETKLAIGSPARPTAIFALSNTIMLGAIRAIGESSLRIPDDVSILSFDNNLFLDFLHPAVTRISQPTKEISQLAVKILMERLSDKQSVPQQINSRRRL